MLEASPRFASFPCRWSQLIQNPRCYLRVCLEGENNKGRSRKPGKLHGGRWEVTKITINFRGAPCAPQDAIPPPQLPQEVFGSIVSVTACSLRGLLEIRGSWHPEGRSSSVCTSAYVLESTPLSRSPAHAVEVSITGLASQVAACDAAVILAWVASFRPHLAAFGAQEEHHVRSERCAGV